MASESEIATKPVLKRLAGFLMPGRLTGPIFDKELRVSARRRRNYVLRFVYLALLTILITLVWMSVVRDRSYYSAAYQISRMAEAGKVIITSIIWFQFCMTMLIAVIMLSTSISDEIHHRTLGVLMTTPINSFQIVMGKLFSKLWQLLILMAISLPLLAIVRVFGGVPLEFVIAGLFITLTGVIFTGAVSMYFSIRSRRAYAVILKTLFTGGILYAFIPFMTIWLLHESVSEDKLVCVFYINPFVNLFYTTITMLEPRMAASGPILYWPLHCAIMLAGSVLVLGLCVRIVRKVALRQATGAAGVFTTRKQRRMRKNQAGLAGAAEPPGGLVRRVTGSPVIWRELKTPLLRGGRRAAVIAVIFTIAALLITYLVCLSERCLDDDETHIIYVLIFVGIGLLVTAVMSATTITTEKETRSWPILLATTLSDWQIVFGKAVGVFRKCLPIWLLLAGHVLLFTLFGIIHPIASLHLIMLVAWIVVFLAGSGLYFSARFRRTTTAVVMNIGLALAIWAILPALTALIAEIEGNDDYDTITFVLSGNPVVQAVVVTEATSGYKANETLEDLDYDWPITYGNNDGVRTTTGRMLAWMSVYILAGFLFACLAWSRLRRNVF
ncbi:MAG: ABC transporter permease subunit [Planctomycetota bacterium]|nr:ABC transporter permease subunit [Planctomycetota bacterium]